MVFSKLAGANNECGSSNGLTHLMKQLGQDRSLQQEHFIQKGQSSKVTTGFRSHQSPAQINHDKLATEFFQQHSEPTIKRGIYTPHQHNLIPEDWTRDFNSYHPPSTHSFEEFETIYQRHHTATHPWSEEFSSVYSQQATCSDVSEEEQLAFERAFEEVEDNGVVFDRDWDKEFAHHEARQHDNVVGLQSLDITDWPEYDPSSDQKINEVHQWNRLKPDGKVYGYRSINPDYENYVPILNNPYLARQDAINKEHDTLADSILALEAKTQLEPNDAKTWEQLGLKQQENERDKVAITALEKAVSIDPSCLDAWLALSVSYRNEHCRMDAYNCLEQWIANNHKYKHIPKESELGRDYTDPIKRHDYIAHIFLEAARTCPGEEMDADVQVGLGILFNMSEEYNKAIDCFKSALITKPDDYQLWNKVGATLANARDSLGAIEMYTNALEINPSYVRARYNLAIGYMNLGQHQEAAQHLLTSLAHQRAAALTAGQCSNSIENSFSIDIPNGTNDNIWNSLRLLMYIMNFEDLATQCHHRNLDAFRERFSF
ncbi:hypothetical protein HPULCUR_010988 [Helicostylum pulchrum]|uniref:Peroxin-5 n=1 Tax=Helicostylum pulchrum TaxID=562976 RepID=A0ABP9YEU2_9FUNG